MCFIRGMMFFCSLLIAGAIIFLGEGLKKVDGLPWQMNVGFILGTIGILFFIVFVMWEIIDYLRR